MTRFTGWHLATIIVSFFAVVFAVNVTMAIMATRTFGGTVVENSYVASQKFNSWLADARRQQSSGLDARVWLDDDRHVTLTIRPELAARAQIPAGHAEHPLGRADDVPLQFLNAGAGRYRSAAPLPAGRWIVRLSLPTREGQASLLEHVE